MKNKVVVITGASQGLGKELSIQLAALGAKIALVARNKKLLSELKTKIIGDGGIAEYYICDVANVEQINSTVSKILDTFKTVDVLINNAGVWTSDKLEEKDKELVQKTFMINSVGPINFYKAIAPVFEKKQKGHIVFINSIWGLDLPEAKDALVYASTKWALNGFARALKYKYSGTDIKITTIFPGPFVSDIDKNAGDDFGDDESKEMKTSEVADTVIYALSASDKMQIGDIELKYTNCNN